MYQEELCIQFKLLTNDNEEYQNCRCPICHNIYKDPLACGNCLNHFCRKCINKWQKNKKKECPLCKNYKEIRAIPLLITILSKLTFFCYNKQNGCNDIIRYQQYFQHSTNCLYRSVKCQNNFCNMKDIKKNIFNHQMHCQFQLIQCKWCYAKFMRKQIEEHQNKCSLKIIECSLCKSQFTLHQQVKHMEVCPCLPVECKFCKESMMQKDFQKHIEQCPQRIVECIGCNLTYNIKQFIIHKTTCQQYPIVCNRCKLNMKRKFKQKHNLEECISFIHQSFLNELSQVKEENATLIYQLELLKKIVDEIVEENEKHHKKIRFSDKKDPDIFILKNQIAVVRQSKKKRRDRYILIDTDPLGDTDVTWKIRIKKMRSQWFAVGITEQSNIFMLRTYQNIGHYTYLLSANGIIYSNHNVHENWQSRPIGMQEEDVIECNYMPKEEILRQGQCNRIKNLKKNLGVNIVLKVQDIKKNRFYPCVCLRTAGDSVQLIE